MIPVDAHVLQAIRLIVLGMTTIKGLDVARDEQTFYENDVIKIGYNKDKFIFRFENLYAEWSNYPDDVMTNIKISPRAAGRLALEAINSIENDTTTENSEFYKERMANTSGASIHDS